MQIAEAEMSHSGIVLRELDSEFETLVADMKPMFLMMTSTFGQRNVALWVKKLYEATGNTVTEKKNRNLYAKALFKMVKQGTVEGVFLDRPRTGPLPPFPSNTSRQHDDIGLTSVLSPREHNDIPDWLMGALPSEYLLDSTSKPNLPLRDPTLGQSRSEELRTSFEAPGKFGMNGLGFDMERHQPLASGRFSVMDDDIPHSASDFLKLPNTSVSAEENGFRSFDTYLSDVSRPVLFREDQSLPLAAGEQMKDKIRNLERGFKEKILLLEGRHDSKIKEILERKNTEILELDEQHKKKCAEAIKQRNLEILQLQQLIGNLQEQLRVKDEDGKSMQQKFSEETLALQHALEQKYLKDLQKHKAEVDEELRMVSEKERKRESELRDLDLRLKHLIGDQRKKEENCKRLETCNEELTGQNKRLRIEVAEITSRCSAREAEIRTLKDEFSSEAKSLRLQSEATVESLRHEHSQKLSIASNTITGLETEIRQLRRDLEFMDQERQLELRAKENENKQLRQQMENEHNLQLKVLQQQLEDREQESNKIVRKLEQTVRDSEDEQSRLAEELAKNMQEMQKNIEENERRTNKLCEEWKQEIERERAKVKTCKLKRLKQEDDFRRQLDEARRLHQQETAESSVRLETEKSRLMQDFRLQKDQLQTGFEAEIIQLRQLHQREIIDIETRLRDTADVQAKTIASKDEKLRKVCEEIVQLGVARDEERKRLEQEAVLRLSQTQSRFETESKEMRRKHSAETEKLVEKNNKGLRDLEVECNSKITKANQVVENLQTTINQLQEELDRQRRDYENQLTQISDRFEAEQKRFVQQNSSHVTELKKEIEELRATLKVQDRHLVQQRLEEEEKVTRIRSQYEEKLKGRLPIAVQKEMEDTIASLKSQIASQRQILDLQNELGLPSQRSSTRVARTSAGSTTISGVSPVKNSV